MERTRLIGIILWLGIVLLTACGALQGSDNSSLMIEDMASYPEILRGWPDQTQVAHFPKTISAEDKNARLFYFPGFMQASRVIQLELELPEAEIANLIEKYQDTSSAGGTPCFYLDKPNTCHSLDNSFRIITLKSEAQGEADFEWNHGYWYGVAISEEKSKVVYWVEDW